MPRRARLGLARRSRLGDAPLAGLRLAPATALQWRAPDASVRAVTERQILGGGPPLSVTVAGGEEGPVQVVLLHGLTATRHYTVMGSRHLSGRGSAPPPTMRAVTAAPARRPVVPATTPTITWPPTWAAWSTGSPGPACRPPGDLDGRPHRRAVRARSPRADRGPPADHACAPSGIGSRRSQRWDALAAALRGPDPVDAFVRALGSSSCPPSCASRSAPRSGSGSPATSTWRPSPTRCRACRAPRPLRRLRSLPRFRRRP